MDSFQTAEIRACDQLWQVRLQAVLSKKLEEWINAGKDARVWRCLVLVNADHITVTHVIQSRAARWEMLAREGRLSRLKY